MLKKKLLKTGRKSLFLMSPASYLRTLLWVCLIGQFALHRAVQALILEDIPKATLTEMFSHKAIGCYIGSFDPIHKGHEEVVHSLLEAGLVDFVLMMPVWGGDGFKNRTSIHHRINMIKQVYAKHPKVLVSALPPKDLQSLLTVPLPKTPPSNPKQYVAPRFPGMTFVGILGTDVALKFQQKSNPSFMSGRVIPEQYHYHSAGTVAGIPASRYIIHLARSEPGTSIATETTINGKPTHIFDPSYRLNLSSTAARKALLNGENVSHLLDASVVKYIQKEDLYGSSPKRR